MSLIFYRIANQEIADERKNKSWLYNGKDKETIPLSEFYEKQRRKYIINIINKNPTDVGPTEEGDDPKKTVVTNETLQLRQYGKKVVGGNHIQKEKVLCLALKIDKVKN